MDSLGHIVCTPRPGGARPSGWENTPAILKGYDLLLSLNRADSGSFSLSFRAENPTVKTKGVKRDRAADG
jgi:hypothetical protein